MTFTIAVAGKGGVGKTSISALIIRYFIKSKKNIVLAVDADSNSNLDVKIGLKTQKTIGTLREDISKEFNSMPEGISKNEYVQCLVRTILTEGKNVDLLVMGRPEGPGCYCYVNSLLRTFIDAIAEKYPIVVIDNEAGMEHLSRRTTHKVDILFVISNEMPAGIRTARKLAQLADEMKLTIKKKILLINHIYESIGNEEKEINNKIQRNVLYEHELEKSKGYFNAYYTIPEDRILHIYNWEGKSLLELPDDSLAVISLNKMMGVIMQ